MKDIIAEINGALLSEKHGRGVRYDWCAHKEEMVECLLKCKTAIEQLSQNKEGDVEAVARAIDLATMNAKDYDGVKELRNIQAKAAISAMPTRPLAEVIEITRVGFTNELNGKRHEFNNYWELTEAFCRLDALQSHDSKPNKE